MMDAARSDIEGVAWPLMVTGEAANTVAVFQQLEDTQWLGAPALQDGQFRQLARLAAHCAEYSAQCAARLRAAGLQAIDLAAPDGLARLKPLGRQAMRQAGPGLLCANIPAAHAPMTPITTAGGLTIHLTALTKRFHVAKTMRGAQWRSADIYDTEEAGILALHCPAGGLYHLMADCALIEILNDDDRPCEQGEAGRIIVTDLHNFATPLIRYETGDRAVAAPPCPCGRGLPTVARIV